jgi:hypothetical protein
VFVLTTQMSNQMRGMRHHNKSKKSIPCGAKGARVEESNKEYTGDALALRGDEGRDKLR